MSHVSDASFDFWETVHCAKCYLPFNTNSNSAPSVPFWLTECGHVICNQHLHADQSCALCGAHPIQLVPLQREMEPPLSNWFRSLPHAIDDIAQTAKFQQESMASLLAFYKSKLHKQRNLIERLKTDAMEAKTLRVRVEELQTENDQLRQYVDSGGSGDTLNRNGKRRIVNPYGDVHSNSSPRSVTTPLAPNRLTFPTGHQEPNFATRSDDGPVTQTDQSGPRGFKRPGSSTFNEQYAYVPPRSSQLRQRTVLSHEQAAPARRLEHINGSRRMEAEAPRSTAKFQPLDPIKNQRTMAPPPTPQHLRPQLHATTPSSRRFTTNSTSDKFSAFPHSSQAHSSQSYVPVPSTPSSAPQRFNVAPTSNFGPSGGVRHTTNVSSGGGGDVGSGGGGQRVPFVISGH